MSLRIDGLDDIMAFAASCKAEGPGATQLPGCRKLYVLLGRQGASEAPYGFLFQLIQKPDNKPRREHDRLRRHPPIRELAARRPRH